jgi:predicted transcriptional regulator
MAIYQIGERHPDYPFIDGVKDRVYEGLFKALGGQDVRSAITFPSVSNYKFERELAKRYPGIKIYCFEKVKGIYDKILYSFHKPDEVELIYGVAEEWLSNSTDKFDLVFFDYCGGPHSDLNELLVSHMNVGGVYAQTEATTHGMAGKYAQITSVYLKPVIEPIRYSLVKFMAYKMVGRSNAVVGPAIRLELADVLAQLKRKHRLRSLEENVREIVAAGVHRDVVVRKFSKYLKKGYNFDGLSISELKPYIEYLPATEVRILEMLGKGYSQKEIGLTLGTTQSSIHARIDKIGRRVGFVRNCPAVSDDEIDTVVCLNIIEKEIVKGMRDTTCQSVTADLVNEKLGLRGAKKMNQVKTRYRFEECIKKLSLESRYSKVHALLVFVKRNLYALHEVVLPQFEVSKRKKLDVSLDLSVLREYFESDTVNLFQAVCSSETVGDAYEMLNTGKGGGYKYRQGQLESTLGHMIAKMKALLSSVPGLLPYYDAMVLAGKRYSGGMKDVSEGDCVAQGYARVSVGEPHGVMQYV